MEQVTVNAKYGISLPLALRRKMNIKIGQKMLIEEKSNHLELTRDIDFAELKGVLLIIIHIFSILMNTVIPVLRVFEQIVLTIQRS